MSLQSDVPCELGGFRIGQRLLSQSCARTWSTEPVDGGGVVVIALRFLAVTMLALASGSSHSFSTCTAEVIDSADEIPIDRTDALYLGQSYEAVVDYLGPPACEFGSGLVWIVWVVVDGRRLFVLFQDKGIAIAKLTWGNEEAVIVGQ